MDSESLPQIAAITVAVLLLTLNFKKVVDIFAVCFSRLRLHLFVVSKQIKADDRREISHLYTYPGTFYRSRRVANPDDANPHSLVSRSQIATSD